MLYLWLIILSVKDNVSINTETLLITTDFVNLKINSTQFLKCAYSDRVYVHI
jgi:hypothetical protein